MKACKDCFYVEKIGEINKHMQDKSRRCMHPNMEVEDTRKTDWYNGGNPDIEVHHHTITTAREHMTLCGPDAKYFKENV